MVVEESTSISAIAAFSSARLWKIRGLAEQPALDDQHIGLDLRLVARPPRPCRQHRAVVMGRHAGVATVDLGIIQARPDHRDLGVVGHKQRRRAAEGLDRMDMSGDQSGSVSLQLASA